MNLPLIVGLLFLLLILIRIKRRRRPLTLEEQLERNENRFFSSFLPEDFE